MNTFDKVFYGALGTILIVLSFVTFGNCQECPTPEYGFDQKDTNKIVLSIEEIRSYISW